MQKIQQFSWASALALVMSAGLIACAGNDVQRTPAEEGTVIGKEQVQKDSTTVSTKRRVTRTITAQQQIPTITREVVYADLNRIDAEGLVTLGVPRDVAQNIVQFRQRQDGFNSVDQLQQVTGITPQLFDQLNDKVAIAR